MVLVRLSGFDHEQTELSSISDEEKIPVWITFRVTRAYFDLVFFGPAENQIQKRHNNNIKFKRGILPHVCPLQRCL